MIIDIVKKSANSKLLKFFFHDILKINLKELTLPRIFIFKLDDLKFDIKTFYDYALKNPKTNYMPDQIDTYQSDHDIEQKPEFGKIKIQIEKFLDEELKKKVFVRKTLGKFKLKSMWFVIMKKNSHHNMHSHPKSAFTGVFYLKVNKNETSGALKIVIPNYNRKEYNLGSFYDEAIKNKTKLEDEKKEIITNIENKIFDFVPDNNDMIVFNSYMIHGIEKYESEEDRIALAWDAVYII